MPYHARTMGDLLFLWHCKEKKTPETLQIRDISHSICTLMSLKHIYKTKDRVTRTPLKTGDELNNFHIETCLQQGDPL
jgi:hypothetical protein